MAPADPSLRYSTTHRRDNPYQPSRSTHEALDRDYPRSRSPRDRDSRPKRTWSDSRYGEDGGQLAVEPRPDPDNHQTRPEVAFSFNRSASSRDPRLAPSSLLPPSPPLEQPQSGRSKPRGSISEDQIEPDMTRSDHLLRGLNSFGQAITATTANTVQADIIQDEATSQQDAERKFGRHGRAFLALSEGFELALKENQTIEERVRHQKAVTEAIQKDIARNLVSELQGPSSSSKSVASARGTESREETKDPRWKSPKEVYKLLDDLKEDIQRLREKTVRKGDLEDKGYITKEQLQSRVAKELVATVARVTALEDEVKKRTSTLTRDGDAKLAAQAHRIDAIKAEIVGLNLALQERATVADRDIAQTNVNNLEVTLQNTVNDLAQLKVVDNVQKHDLEKLKLAVFDEAGDRDGKPIYARLDENTTAMSSLYTEIQVLKAECSNLQTMVKESPRQSPGVGPEKLETLIESTLSAVRKEQEGFETTISEEIDRSQAMIIKVQAELNQVKNRPAQLGPVARLPTPPRTNFPVGMGNGNGNNKSLEPESRELWAKITTLEKFVENQQQKFDSLTTAAVTQNMINHMSGLYQYHPNNLIAEMNKQATMVNTLNTFACRLNGRVLALEDDVPALSKQLTSDREALGKRLEAAVEAHRELKNMAENNQASLLRQLEDFKSELLDNRGKEAVALRDEIQSAAEKNRKDTATSCQGILSAVDGLKEQNASLRSEIDSVGKFQEEKDRLLRNDVETFHESYEKDAGALRSELESIQAEFRAQVKNLTSVHSKEGPRDISTKQKINGASPNGISIRGMADQAKASTPRVTGSPLSSKSESEFTRTNNSLKNVTNFSPKKERPPEPKLRLGKRSATAIISSSEEDEEHIRQDRGKRPKHPGKVPRANVSKGGRL